MQCGCGVVHGRGHRLTNEFIFWVHVNTRDAGSGREVLLRGALSSAAPHRCFTRGHLRVMHLTTLFEDPNMPGFPAQYNMPLPYFPVGAPRIFINLFFHIGDIEQPAHCPKHEEDESKYVTFPGVSRDGPQDKDKVPRVEMDGVTVSPSGRQCQIPRVVVDWTEQAVFAYIHSKDQLVHTVHVECQDGGLTEAGWWTVRLWKSDHRTPYVYESRVFLYDMKTAAVSASDARSLFTLDKVITLPEEDHYSDQNDIEVYMRSLDRSRTAPAEHEEPPQYGPSEGVLGQLAFVMVVGGLALIVIALLRTVRKRKPGKHVAPQAKIGGKQRNTKKHK